MASNLDLFSNALKQYVVTPLNAFGFGGFVFDIEGEATANLQAEITDHFIEDNSTVQDHISIKPKRFVLKGYVGELIFQQDNTNKTPVNKVVQKLTTLSAILPTISTGAQQAYDFFQANKLSDLSLDSINLSSVNKITDFYALAKNLASSGSKQQQAYKYFEALYSQKVLFSVQTPFEFVNNMAIESISAVQSENTRFVTDFTVTLKQIRTAAIAYAELAASAQISVRDNPPLASDNSATNIINGSNTPVLPAYIPDTDQLQGRASQQQSLPSHGGLVRGKAYSQTSGDAFLNEIYGGDYNALKNGGN